MVLYFISWSISAKAMSRTVAQNHDHSSPGVSSSSKLWQFGLGPPGIVRQEESESVQKRAARFLTGNYSYETGSMTGILGQLNGNPSRNGGTTIDLYCYIMVSKYTNILSPNLGVVEIRTLWHFRLPLLIQKFIKVASSPILSRIGVHSPILWSHLLKLQRTVLLNSLLWWELGTYSLITGPGEWLSFRRFTTKLFWFWIQHDN